MFGMSMTEIVIIVIFALLVLGPGELPSAARTIGKTLREVRRAGDDLRDTFEREVMQEKPLKVRPVAESVAKDAPPPGPAAAPQASSLGPAEGSVPQPDPSSPPGPAADAPKV
jgi:sec-independent protein translocase protein TatB